MSKVFILSTMTSPVTYNLYGFNGEEKSKQGLLPFVKERVTIFGGAGLPSYKSGIGEMKTDEEGKPIWTASGFVTPIDESKFDWLKENHVFKLHLKNGYLKVISRDIRQNHGAIVEEINRGDMQKRDGSAQLTPATAKQQIGKVQIKLDTVSQEQEYRI